MLSAISRTFSGILEKLAGKNNNKEQRRIIRVKYRTNQNQVQIGDYCSFTGERGIFKVEKKVGNVIGIGSAQENNSYIYLLSEERGKTYSIQTYILKKINQKEEYCLT